MFHTFFVAKIIYAHFFVANTINAHFLLQKLFEHTFFVAKTNYAHIFSQKLFMHFFVTKRICAHFFLLRKRFRCFFCRENDLRTSPRKFLRVESCYLESSDFWDLCPVHIKRNENYEKKREGDGAVLC